jgi:tetratricopeptide (TPR) repeat protein
VAKFGQFGKDLGPVYVAYGKVLLQLGMVNKDSLLNTEAMPEQVVEEIAASSMIDGGEKRRKLVDLHAVTFEDEEEEEQEEGGSEGEDKDEGAVEEETSDELELAWEVLDLARLIYADSASSDQKARIALSNVYCDLGDVSMETESFSQAADDFLKAIEIKKDLGVDHERDLASVYFKYAMALEYNNCLSEAVDPLIKAETILKSRLIRLGNESDDKGKEKVSNMGSGEHEIDELQQLLPDVKSKLDDVKAQIAGGNTAHMDPSQIKETINAAAMGAIQDLSGLVRKRKAGDN